MHIRGYESVYSHLSICCCYMHAFLLPVYFHVSLGFSCLFCLHVSQCSSVCVHAYWPESECATLKDQGETKDGNLVLPNLLGTFSALLSVIEEQDCRRWSLQTTSIGGLPQGVCSPDISHSSPTPTLQLK